MVLPLDNRGNTTFFFAYHLVRVGALYALPLSIIGTAYTEQAHPAQA
jgi:hypothetical protein